MSTTTKTNAATAAKKPAAKKTSSAAKKTTAAKKTPAKPARSPFSQNALFCENYEPKVKLVYSGASFEPLEINGCHVMGLVGERPYKIFIQEPYLPAEEYRAWLRSVYPEYSIVEEYIRIEDVRGWEDETSKPYVVAKVKVYRTPDDKAPFEGIGYAKYTLKDSYESLTKFARASALKRAMYNQGFGEGLDWNYIKMESQPYITDALEDDDKKSFRAYTGPLFCNGEVIKESEEKVGTASEIGKAGDIVRPDTEDIQASMSEPDNSPEAVAQAAKIAIPTNGPEACSYVMSLVDAHNKSCGESK